jgi:hypothetical protein
MSIVIKGMGLPEKCCKCAIYRKANAICPVAGRHVADPSVKPAWCPVVEHEMADAVKLRGIWAAEPEILETIEKAVIL